MKRFRFSITVISLGFAGASVAAAQPDAGFSGAMDGAMNRMMAAMHVRSSGDVDRDFVQLMVPHHQAAIDMAVAELRHGRNRQVQRIAQEIIVDQQQEIAAMHLAVGDPLPEAGPAPTQRTSRDRAAQLKR